MIDARELRIGNLVTQRNKETIEVFTVRKGVRGDADEIIYEDEKSIYFIDCSNAEPIPLSEKWLTKFGFDENGCKYIGVDVSFKTLQIARDGVRKRSVNEKKIMVLTNA